MSEPITTGLRALLCARPLGDPCWDAMDAIDAVHAGLERENESLRRELDRVLGESDSQGDSMHEIGSATITITPTLDWTGVARELRAIADTLAGDAE